MDQRTVAACLDDGLIASFVAGAVDPALLPQIEEHLAECAVCRSAAAAGVAYDASTEVSRAGASSWHSAPSASLIAERFEQRELIARGGMGLVYRGYDRVTREAVAIKVIRPALLADHPDLVERFVREGEILQRLNHPNIVKMIAAVRHAEQQYIVLEYVAGGSLRDLLRTQGRLPVARAAAILLEISDALARAHHLDTLHRDVKPENVLIAADGTPRLTDFGLALSGGQRLTESHAVLGTLTYLSPEALSGEPLDGRADVWACGVMLFEMLVGRSPFEAGTHAAVVTGILQREPPDLRGAVPHAPPALLDLVCRMLKKNRHERVGSARQVAVELERILEHLGVDRRPTQRSPTRTAEVTAGGGRSPEAEPIYGRREILERMCRARQRAGTGAGRLLILTGEAGIGKSLLAQHLVAEAVTRGARAARGRCWEAGGAPSYWPWLSIFRDVGLENPFAPVAAQLSAGALEARFAAFESAGQALKAAAFRQPLAILLDDLHVADTESLLFLLFLARELPRMPILIVAAYRDGEAAPGSEAGELLAQLARDAEVYPLTRLALPDVEAWLAAARVTSNSRTSAELFRVTEGHPLLIAEMLRLSPDALARDAWPTPRSLFAARLVRLSGETRRVLEVGAIWGREFNASDVAATALLAPDQVFLALREARAASLLEASRDGERQRFSHVLVRDQLYADLSPSIRSTWHLEAGKLLVLRQEPRVAIHHLLEACAVVPEGARAELSIWIAPVAISAAAAALDHWAFEEASRLGRRVLTMFASQLSERVHCELSLLVAEALIRRGQIHEGKTLCEQAAERARSTSAHDLFARAALVHATELSTGIADTGMVSRLRQALAALQGSDTALTARLMARLATALTPVRVAAQGEEAVALARAANAMARRLDDPQTLLYVLQVGTHVGSYLPEVERLAFARDSLALARELGQPLASIGTLPCYVTMLAARGERDHVDAELARYDETLSAFPQPLHRIRRLLVDSIVAILRGDLERAERADAAARAIAERADAGAAQHCWVIHQLSRAQLLDRPEFLRAESAQLMAHWTLSGESGIAAWVLAANGREEEARRHLVSVPESHPCSYGLMAGAEACVLLRDATVGEAVYALLTRARTPMFFAGGAGNVFGPMGRILGHLALLLGRRTDALRHYDEALAACEKLGAAPLIELCRRARAAATDTATHPLAVQCSDV